MSTSLIILTLISALLFVSGVLTYWLCTSPLKSLPTWNEMNAMIENEKAKK